MEVTNACKHAITKMEQEALALQPQFLQVRSHQQQTLPLTWRNLSLSSTHSSSKAQLQCSFTNIPRSRAQIHAVYRGRRNTLKRGTLFEKCRECSKCKNLA